MKPFDKCDVAVFLESPSLFAVSYEQLFDAVKKGVEILISSSAFTQYLSTIKLLKDKNNIKEAKRFLKLMKELDKHKMLIIYEDKKQTNLIDATSRIISRRSNKNLHLFIDDEAYVKFFNNGLEDEFKRNKKDFRIGYIKGNEFKPYNLKLFVPINKIRIENVKDEILEEEIIQEPAENENIDDLNILKEPSEGELLLEATNEPDHEKEYVNFELKAETKQKLLAGPKENMVGDIDLKTSFETSLLVSDANQNNEVPTEISTEKIEENVELPTEEVEEKVEETSKDDVEKPEEKVDEKTNEKEEGVGIDSYSEDVDVILNTDSGDNDDFDDFSDLFKTDSIKNDEELAPKDDDIEEINLDNIDNKKDDNDTVDDHEGFFDIDCD